MSRDCGVLDSRFQFLIHRLENKCCFFSGTDELELNLPEHSCFVRYLIVYVLVKYLDIGALLVGFIQQYENK